MAAMMISPTMPLMIVPGLSWLFTMATGLSIISIFEFHFVVPLNQKIPDAGRYAFAKLVLLKLRRQKFLPVRRLNFGSRFFCKWPGRANKLRRWKSPFDRQPISTAHPKPAAATLESACPLTRNASPPSPASPESVQRQRYFPLGSSRTLFSSMPASLRNSVALPSTWRNA